MARSAPVAALLDRFHAARPVRASSLIVTLYGDAIVPRGGSLWLGSLAAIMARFRIDAGHVRTAMSRLTAEGWLTRARMGRNSFYRLSRRGEQEFAAATRRIYFAGEQPFDGRLRVALIGPGIDDRAALRPALERAGFVALSPTSYVGVAEPPPALLGIEGLFFLHGDRGEAGARLAAAAWRLEATGRAYLAFIDAFAPLEPNLAGIEASDADALVARTLLIHQFRRVVLRDPHLPAALLPAGWPGAPARALAARLYGRLVPPAERFLSEVARNEHGPLPPPDACFAARFR